MPASTEAANRAAAGGVIRRQPYKAKQAVYIAVVPDDWKPQRPWDFPPVFLSAELYAKNLPMFQAQGFVRTYNKRQLQDVLPDRKWAIVAKDTKVRKPHWHHNVAKVKGGAASCTQ